MLKEGLEQLLYEAGELCRGTNWLEFVDKQDAKCRPGDRICREGAKRIARGPANEGCISLPNILLVNSSLFTSQNQLTEI